MAFDMMSFLLGTTSSGGGSKPVPTEFEIVNQDGIVGVDNYIYGALKSKLGFEIGNKYHLELYTEGDIKVSEDDLIVEAGTGIYSGYNILNYQNDFIIVDEGKYNYTTEPISVSPDNKASWRWRVGLDDKFYIKCKKVETPIPSGKGTIPFSNIFDCIESTELVGLKQSTAPTPYEDESHIWHNLYWLDDSVTPNVWKKYNTVTEQWELV